MTDPNTPPQESAGSADETETSAVSIDDDRPAEAAEPVPSAEEVAETAREFLTGVFEAMGIECSVDAEVQEKSAAVNVTGEGMGIVIGRKGQTLDALQEITRTAVQRKLRARVRLQVDVESYKERRKDSLGEYARSMADRARERGTEIELEPMNAYERKIIHDAVGEVEGVTSFSEGEEPARKVIVRGTVS